MEQISDSVWKAVHSFPSTSGAGKSGLRPSHIREATRPASSDLLFRLITEVVNLLLQGRFTIGAWPLWVSPLGGSELVLLVSMLPLLTSPVSLLAVTSAASSGILLILSILMRVAALVPLSLHSGS